MSKFKKETTERLKLMSKGYAEFYNDKPLKKGEYKRELKSLERLCIIMGDELPEECNWGPIIKYIEEEKKNSTFLKTATNVINNIALVHKNINNYSSLSFFACVFFYYEAKENI